MSYYVRLIHANFTLTAELTELDHPIEVGSGYYVGKVGTSELIWGPGTPTQCEDWIKEQS